MIFKLKIFTFFLSIIAAVPPIYYASDFPINYNPQSYVLNKFQSHDIVFLGTRHKQPPVLKFISKIITELHNSGVTHIGMEIASDQQGKIDHYMNTGAGLKDIQIHPQIDCPEYRNLFKVIRGLDPDKRPILVALDLPKSKYKVNISRDEWIARSIAGVFESNANAKMLVAVGNYHTFKKQDWQDHAVNRPMSIREYLSEKHRKLRIFSIGQVIGKTVYEDDFRREFGQIEGAVAVDLDGQFAGWKLVITQSVAIKPAEVWKLLDGVIVY
jgi:hypothetical protein